MHPVIGLLLVNKIKNSLQIEGHARIDCTGPRIYPLVLKEQPAVKWIAEAISQLGRSGLYPRLRILASFG